MSRTLRWGILGTGNIARQFAAGLAGGRRGRVTAVASRAQDNADALAASHRIATAWGSYEHLLADPEVDAVYNALPNSLHHRWTIAALRAGKHVLCEKPFALDVEQSQEMFDVAEQAGRIVMEAFMYRTHPLTDAVLAVVRNGTIGQLRLIRTSFCYRTTRIDGNVRFSLQLGGGALMDIGCYCISFARLFANQEPDTIHAAGQMHSSGVDEMTAGAMHFPNGILSSFACGMSAQADNTAHLCGSDGFIEIPIPWKPPKTNAQFTISHGIPPRMDTTAKIAPPAPPPPQKARSVDAGQDLYALEADEFARSVLDGVPPRVSRSDTLGNMRVLDEMRRQIGLSF